MARLAASGDRTAFAAIFERYHQDLYRYCVSLVHNTDDAADALQSTMLHALRALEGDDRDIALRPWLYRIAHNECISLLRRRRQSELNGDGVSVTALDVEGSAAVRARLQTVLEDIRSLPDRQRAALVMRELAGLSYSEIAEALVSSPAGAKQAVYDARRALLDLSKGRDETCESIQRRISAGDRRVTRARGVRAHLRACTDCRMFAMQMSDREQALAGLAPVLPAAVAAHVLKGAFVGAGGASAEGVIVGAGATMVGQAVATAAVTIALGAGVAGLELAERNDARGDSGANGRSMAVAPGHAHATHRSARKPADRGGGEVARGSARSKAARSAGGDARASRGGRAARDDYTRRSSWEPPVDRRASTVSVPTQSTQSTQSRRGGRLGLRPGSGGASSDDRGLVGTTVDQVRDSVPATVGGTVDALPIKPPKLPIRERRR